MIEFSLFARLPPELRNIIWEKALPRPLGPQLYCYRKDCWRPRHLTPEDQGFEPDNDGIHLAFEFHHEFLNPVRIDVPLFFVNREAHGIAAAWMHMQGLRLQLRSYQHGTFARLFDPNRDALYVPTHEWNTFLCEPTDRQFQPDLLNRNLDCPGVYFTRLAFQEAMLEYEEDLLPELFDWYDRVDQVYVLSDPGPDLQSTDENTSLQERCEMEDAPGPAYCWDGGGFRWNGARADGYGEIYAKIERISIGLQGLLDENRKLRYEIRPAMAVPDL